MRRAYSAIVGLALCGSLWLVPSSALAIPKLDIKVFAGAGTTTLVPQLPRFALQSGAIVGGTKRETYVNWQSGVSARVLSHKVFGEIGMVFSRFGFRVPEAEEDPISAEFAGKRGHMNSFDIPITAGYVPYGNPIFKLFLYGGLVNKFNVRGFIDNGRRRDRIKIKPHDADLAIYQAGIRLGIQFDLGPINVDANYTIGLNGITSTAFRTNSHVTQLNLGWLF